MLLRAASLYHAQALECGSLQPLFPASLPARGRRGATLQSAASKLAFAKAAASCRTPKLAQPKVLDFHVKGR
jgi:hypothetical protein